MRPLSTLPGLSGAIGKTPLIHLKSISAATGCTILGKAEWMNPGGSVKDRAALGIVAHAEEQGLLKEGGCIVEGTAGNTGIGLAHVAASRGYSCVIYMPDSQSSEKIDLLRALGAEVHLVPVVPYTDPNNYNHVAKRRAEGDPTAVWTDQFDNVANRYAHFTSTGPEIYSQLDGNIDAFVAATGTGGTLAGVGLYLKSMRDSIQVVLADPPGSVLYNHFEHGKLEREGDGSITEGIGQGRLTKNMEDAPVDAALHIPDEASLNMTFRLLQEEGIFVGASSGLNVEAARQLALRMGPGHTIVTVLCDSAQRYQSRLFSKGFLEQRGLLQSLDPKYHRHLAQ